MLGEKTDIFLNVIFVKDTIYFQNVFFLLSTHQILLKYNKNNKRRTLKHA